MKTNIKFVLVALAIAICLSAWLRVEATLTAPVPVRSFVMTSDLFDKRNTLTSCFTTAGDVRVKLHAGKCPSKVAFEKEEAGLLKSLGAPRKLLSGYTVVYTKHVVLLFRYGVIRWVNGVTLHGKLKDGTVIKFIAITTTRDEADCSITDTTRHELAHAAFNAVGLSSQWLDEPDDTPCTHDDGSELRRLVMTPGEKLPPGLIRDRFESAGK